MTRDKMEGIPAQKKTTRVSLDKLRKTRGRTNFAKLYAEQAREKSESAEKKS